MGKGYSHGAPHVSGHGSPKMDHEHGQTNPQSQFGSRVGGPGNQLPKQSGLRGSAGKKVSDSDKDGQ